MGRLLIILLTGLLGHAVSCQAQPKPDSSQLVFPDVVQKVKKSLVYIQVGTNIPNKVKVGSGFVIVHTDKVVVISTCYHVLFEPDTTNVPTLIPDTARIFIKFLNSDRVISAKYLAGREDRDIALLAVHDTSGLLQSMGLEDTQPANNSDVVEGLDVGFTGYESNIVTSEFGKTHVWPITRRGIISSVHGIGPSESDLYLDYFYVDMIITKGGSGGPVYDARTGTILGMFKGYLPFQGTEVSKGLSQCVPTWVIMSVWNKRLSDAKSRMEQEKK